MTHDPTAGSRMSHAEESDLKKAFERDKWAGEWNSLPTAIDRLLAARAAAPDPLREGIEALATELDKRYGPFPNGFCHSVPIHEVTARLRALLGEER